MKWIELGKRRLWVDLQMQKKQRGFDEIVFIECARQRFDPALTIGKAEMAAGTSFLDCAQRGARRHNPSVLIVLS
jgi:hypothetical protein